MAVVSFKSSQRIAGNPIAGNPSGKRSEKFNAARLKRERRGRDDSTNDNKKRHRFVPEEHFSKDENSKRDSGDQQRNRIRLVEMFEEIGAVVPEAAMCAFKAEKLGQLRASKKESYAALKTGHHTFRDEVHDHPRFNQPCDERDQRDE